MTARTLPDGTLLVTHRAWGHVVGVLGLAALAAWALLDPTPEQRQRLGGVFYVGFALLLAATYEASSFRFDPAEARLEWEHLIFFRRRAGVVSFEAIEALALEGDRSGRARYLRRLAIVTRGGRVPLTSAYYANVARLTAVGDAISAVVGARRELPFYQ